MSGFQINSIYDVWPNVYIKCYYQIPFSRHVTNKYILWLGAYSFCVQTNSLARIMG